MIMAFFIGFSYALGFFNIISCQRLDCFAFGAAQQHQRKNLQGLRLNFPKIFFKRSMIDQQCDGADLFAPLRKRGRVQFAQAKEGEMSCSIPSFIRI
jgi:hypothetical protein